jgi:hypothetical protein
MGHLHRGSDPQQTPLMDPPECQCLATRDSCLSEDSADVVDREFAVPAVSLNGYGPRITRARPDTVAALRAGITVTMLREEVLNLPR